MRVGERRFLMLLRMRDEVQENKDLYWIRTELSDSFLIVGMSESPRDHMPLIVISRACLLNKSSSQYQVLLSFYHNYSNLHRMVRDRPSIFNDSFETSIPFS